MGLTLTVYAVLQTRDIQNPPAAPSPHMHSEHVQNFCVDLKFTVHGLLMVINVLVYCVLQGGIMAIHGYIDM